MIFEFYFFFSSAVAEGIPADNPHFVLLFFMIQLFLRELAKCSRLIQVIPMDMSSYYGESAFPRTVDLFTSQDSLFPNEKFNFCRENKNVFLFLLESLNRPGTSNFSNVISQILLCKTITPDFNAEEICSIAKDSEEIGKILQEMQEFMPQQENQTGNIIFFFFKKKRNESITWFCSKFFKEEKASPFLRPYNFWSVLLTIEPFDKIKMSR